jgi:hypothetical protein
MTHLSHHQAPVPHAIDFPLDRWTHKVQQRHMISVGINLRCSDVSSICFLVLGSNCLRGALVERSGQREIPRDLLRHIRTCPGCLARPSGVGWVRFGCLKLVVLKVLFRRRWCIRIRRMLGMGLSTRSQFWMMYVQSFESAGCLSGMSHFRFATCDKPRCKHSRHAITEPRWRLSPRYGLATLDGQHDEFRLLFWRRTGW